MPERRTRVRRNLVGAGPVDVMDAAVIGAAALLAVGLLVAGAVSPRSGDRASSEVRPIAAASVEATPTEPPAPRVDVIAASTTDASTIASGVEGAVRASTRVLSGNGFTAAERGYPSVAAGVDRDASVVVVVPAASDRAAGLFDLQSRVSTTVAVIAKRAPDARVVLVGPVVSSTQGASLPAMRASLRSLAKTLDVTYADPTDHDWVRDRVDANGRVTAAGLKSVANGIGDQVESLL